jgi:hypothetical protein
MITPQYCCIAVHVIDTIHNEWVDTKIHFYAMVKGKRGICLDK